MNAGVYYCNKKLLKLIKNQKKSLENQIIPDLIKNQKVSGEIIKNTYFLDIGTPYYLQRSEKILKKHLKNQLHFLIGITLIYDKGYTYKLNDLN